MNIGRGQVNSIFVKIEIMLKNLGIKKKIVQEFEENNVDSIVISYKKNVIPNPYIIEKDFEHNDLKSQLLWYYNSGLHRFSEIDNLPSKEAEKIL